MTTTAEAPPEEEPAPVPEKGKPSGLRTVVEWVLMIGVAVGASVVIKTFLFQAFFIPSPSMVPTLQVHDRVLVNKLSYKVGDVERGDVVVFERPPNDTGTIRDLIKRVVAVGGDTIESRGDTLYVNDQPVRESYRKTASIGNAVTRMTIPPGQVFVMGDNRTNSSDSRVFGPIDEDVIVGRAFVKIWPVQGWRLL